ncbi:MAG: tetratricopeptide repeat protein [Anaerolineae bacterium]|nr:tetratricopeptide repeat protein [Anaerolineae bacterium]
MSVIATPSVQSAQSRLTRHYLDKLRKANDGVRRGPGNRQHWHRVMEQDWEQIKQRQAWAAARTTAEPEQARLCTLFTIATADILRVQLTSDEQLAWTQQALAAAQSLHDGEAERTLLYQAAFLSLTSEKLDLAEQYVHQLLALPQSTQDDLSLGRAWYILGTLDFTRGALDEALDYYKRSIVQFERCQAASEMAVVWRGLGRALQFGGQYQQARDNFQRYLDASSAADSAYGVFDAHVGLSGICLALHDYQAAQRYAQRAVTLGRAFEHSRLFPPALLSLAHAEKWLAQYESANAHYVEALAIARLVCSPSTISNGLYGLGQSMFLQGNYGAALIHLREAVDVAREAQFAIRVCEASLDIVYVLVAQHELSLARDQLRDALTMATRIGTPHFLVKALAAAISLWHAQGEGEQAALWAALLAQHKPQLHPSLFDLSIYTQLEAELGSRRYDETVTRGELLTLEDAIHTLDALLATAAEHHG